MKDVGLDEELSFRQAAAQLKRRHDPHGRRLRNMVLARERQSGQQIAVRLAGQVEPKTRVTLGALYRAFPELREARVDQLASMAKPLLERAEARTRDVVRSELSRDIGPRVSKLEKRTRILQRAMVELAELDAEN